MKKLGVIGGLGPMATAYFLQLLVQMTEARTDQEHIEVLLLPLTAPVSSWDRAGKTPCPRWWKSAESWPVKGRN